jgi:hypothetical protein
MRVDDAIADLATSNPGRCARRRPDGRSAVATRGAIRLDWTTAGTAATLPSRPIRPTFPMAGYEVSGLGRQGRHPMPEASLARPRLNEEARHGGLISR